MKKAGEDLRKKAENLLCASRADIAKIPSQVIQKLVYEFQVHQIKLELQNEELKNAQYELAQSRDHYQDLYHSAPIGYLTLNEEGSIIMANPAAHRILGVSLQSLINKKIEQFINPKQQNAYHLFLQDILYKPGEHILNIILQHINDSSNSISCHGVNYFGCTCVFSDNYRFVELRGAICSSNNDKHIVLSLYDLTEVRKSQEVITCLNQKLEHKVFQQTQKLHEASQQQRETIEQLALFEKQLNEREAKLNAIFNAAVEGIISLDKRWNIVSFNNTVINLFGYRQEELIGHNIRKIISLKQYTRKANFNFYKLIGKIREVTGKCKDGSTIPLEISSTYYRLSDKKYHAIIVRDISDRKLREIRDKQHLDELAHVTRLGLLGELASGIAHEVNQPLTAIVNYTQASLNLLELNNFDLVKLENILTKTNQQALKAGQIIHRMRDFIKVKEIHRSTANINKLIENAIDLCASYIKQNSIDIKLQLDRNLPAICIDSIQIEQVILNLIKNATDALSSEPNSYYKKLSIETKMVDFNHIKVRVKDNGPGIDIEEQKKILTPFYSTKNNGMGMGLSICRSIIESHCGVLSFNSCPGKGSTFYFCIPTGKKTNG